MKPFSLFPRGIKSTIPYEQPYSLQQIFGLITSETCKPETDRLRELIAKNAPAEQTSKFKSSNFYYVCFSGTFSQRGNKYLIDHSGLMSLDLDDVDNLEFIFDLIIHDEELNPLLVFRSPSGNGIKIVVEIPADASKQVDFFNDYSNLIYHKYRIKPDRTCKDVARACYLPCDPNAYINPHALCK